MNRLEKPLPRPTKRTVMLLSPLLKLSQRTTASLMKSTSLNLPKRSSPSVPVSQRHARRMKVASKTRSGHLLSLSLKRKKKTLLPVPVERPSVNVSANRSKSSTSTNASRKPQSAGDVEVQVDSVEVAAVVEIVVTDHPEAEVAEEVVVMETEDVVVVAATEVLMLLAVAHATMPLAHHHPSTPRIPKLSQAWEHKYHVTRPGPRRQQDFLKSFSIQRVIKW